MTEVLAPSAVDRQPQQPSSVVLKHLLWKDVRTFGLPALVFVAAYFLMTLAAYIFSPNEIDFGKVANAILIFTSYGLAMLWATAAGAIVTASDREDGTDTWMRSLPVASWSVFLCRVAVAYLSVAAIGVSCAIGLIWCVKCGPEGCVPIMLSDDPFLAARAAGFFSMAAAFLASGLLVGTVLGRVMAAVLLGAMLPIVVGMVAAMADFPAATVATQRAAYIATLLFLGLLVVAAVMYSGWIYTRGVYPQWSSATTAGAGSWRRKLANRVSPTRRTRSLVSRELHALARFLPIAAVYLLLTLYIHEPVGWYVVVMFVPWAAGLALAGTDGRDDTLPFLTHRGVSGAFVWAVKNLVWGLSVATLLIVFFNVVEQVLVTPSHPESFSWRIDSDRGIKDGPPVPSSAMATLYASAESRLTNSNIASVPKRHFIVATAATLGITLFLLGQIAGFWCGRKVVAMAVSLLVCIPWMFLHSVTAAFETPGWAVNAVPLVILIVFAARAGVDAVNQQSPWLRRGVIGVCMLLLFIFCVRTARVNSFFETSAQLTVELLQQARTPSRQTAALFRELSNAYLISHPLPADVPSEPGTISKIPETELGQLESWLKSGLGAQFFYRHEFDDYISPGFAMGFDEEFANEDTSELSDDARLAARTAYDQQVAATFNQFVDLHKRFVDSIKSNPRMPSGTKFASFNEIEGITATLLIDAKRKWFEGNEDAAWDSWIDAWIVADYFAKHDGEWMHLNDGYQVSPTSLEHAHAARSMTLNALLDRLKNEDVSLDQREIIHRELIDHSPKPVRELADAAYRVLIAREPRWSAPPSVGMRLLDFYLASSDSQDKADRTAVALLERLASYGEQTGVRLSDIAMQHGLTAMDVKKLKASTMVMQFDPSRPAVWPFLQAVEHYQRNLGQGNSDVSHRYDVALAALETSEE